MADKTQTIKQLKVKDLLKILQEMPPNSIVYLGDDEELNGMHEAFFCQMVNREFVNSISYGSLDKAGILIS